MVIASNGEVTTPAFDKAREGRKMILDALRAMESECDAVRSKLSEMESFIANYKKLV
jgi:hypothetical protein